jgi:osmotically-inducible protein OsmY
MKVEHMTRGKRTASFGLAVALSLAVASGMARAATADEAATQPAVTEQPAPATQPAAPRATQPAAPPAVTEQPAAPPAAIEKPAPATAEKVAKPARKSARAETGGVRTDGSALARLVKERIDADSSIVVRDALHLRISTNGRMVALSGTAGTIYDREHAARLAEGADKVSGIHPSITIKPPSGTDTAGLKAAVEKAVADAGVAGEAFAAAVSADGVVELNGAISDSWAAINSVKKVPGVTAIKSFKAARKPGHGVADGAAPSVVPPSPEKDPAIATAVAAAFAGANLAHLSTTVERAMVKISGRAASAREWWIANRTALAVPGVLGVNTAQLTISGRARRTGETRDGADVEREVRSSIRRHLMKLDEKQGTSYRIHDLGVRAAQGTVMISGRATSEDAAYAAVDAALSVAGVQEVVNALNLM